MATYESNPGHLAGIWRSQDDIIMHISNQIVQIWEHCEFPNGHICVCRPYMDRMESKPQRYVLVVRTPHDRAKDIDWDKAEWTVNVVGEPQLKIKAVQIDEHTLFGKHAGWDITFNVDVLDVVKPEDEDAIMPFSVREGFAEDSHQKFKRALNSMYGYLTSTRAFNNPGFDLSVLNDTINPLWPKDNPALKYINTDIALTRAAYKRGGNTMNKYEIRKLIRDCGYTDYQRRTIEGFLCNMEFEDYMRNGLQGNGTLNEVRNSSHDIMKTETVYADNKPLYTYPAGMLRRDLRPSPKKVIYNGPATIVIFEDGSKTVVKLQEGEQMDREKAVYAAICKRMFGSNKNQSNWLDMLKPLMKEADEAWRVKTEKKALNDNIKKYSCKMEFDDYEDAADFLNLIGVLNDNYDKREKTVANILGYPGVIALRKSVKAAREMVKDGEGKA